MHKETRLILAAASILLAVLVIILIMLSGADVSSFQIHKGIHLN